MNRPLLKRVFPQALAWTAAVGLCGAMALGQDAATANATAPSPTTAAAPSAAAATRTDGQIETDVVHALDASKALKDDLITAATIQGEVTLSGTVSTEASSELAEAIASHVAGVTKVNNNLKVGNPQAAADAQPPAESQPDNPDNAAAEPAPAPGDGPMAVPNQPQAPSASQPVAPAPPARPQYQPPRPPAQAYEPPKGPVTIPQGTLIQLRTNEPVSSKRAKDGTPVEFTVIHDVVFGGVLAIPRGATAHGVVTEVKQAGDLKGSPELALKLTSLDLGGQNYPLDSDQFKVKGPGKGGQTASNVVGGAALGAMIGAIAGRGAGAAIGAGAGAAAGTAASAATPGPGVWIPSEARVDFHLNKPLTVTPVSAQEAARLAQGLYPGGPNLYRRGYGPYGYPYYASYPYGYPPVYYRPYYVVGGFYYWR
ncbi:MAG: BON domain-containing protein [Terracidiphilus sp.]